MATQITSSEPSKSELMYLVIEEELIEGYYLVYGDPISVHWDEGEANSTADELQTANKDHFYKVLPVKVG